MASGFTRLSRFVHRPERKTVSPLDVVRRLRAAGCVFADEEAHLLIQGADNPETLAAMVEQRVAGLPLEHVLGWVDFCGLRLAVDRGVFVPRRRTELLVRLAAARCAPGATVVDLACGCGAVGRAIAALFWPVTVHAVDIDPAAVRCARRNLAVIGGRAYPGDLYQPLPAGLRGTVDALVANVPYVPTGALDLLPPEARVHEPLRALDGGFDGLEILRRVAASAPGWLAHGGHLLVEIALDQSDAARAALTLAGLAAAVVHDAELGATVVIGRAGGPPQSALISPVS
jgi:release factor glutamine methyltransferase